MAATEYLLTAWALGLQPNGRGWWFGLLRSPLHAGVWLLVVAAALKEPGRLLDLARVPLTFQVIAAGGACTVAGLSWAQRAFAALADEEKGRLADEARARTATWLHNEVTPQVHLLRFGVESGRVAPDELPAELEKLEHALRVRQVDELVASGQAELADITQPYARLAQAQGVEVEVPHLETTSLVPTPEEGDLVQDTLGVLVPNALSAGAEHVAIRADVSEPGVLVLEVEDDAGGFDLASAPAGRGLHRLQERLGANRLTCTPAPGGSCLRAVVDVAATIPGSTRGARR